MSWLVLVGHRLARTCVTHVYNIDPHRKNSSAKRLETVLRRGG